MRTWLGALGVLALVAGCDRRPGQETSRSGTDTTIRSSTVKDTTIVHADTTIDVDTVRNTSHIPAGAEDSVKGVALKWGPRPPGLPEGAQAAVVEGDPSKAGPFVVRLDLPDGYEVRPHWHPTSERISVLRGTFLMGDGRNWRDETLRALRLKFPKLEAPEGLIATFSDPDNHYFQLLSPMDEAMGQSG